MNLALTQEQIKEILAKNDFVVFKYVRVGEDYRFAVVDVYGVEHKQLLNNKEKAKSAGFCTLDRGQVILPEIPSTSLKLGPAPDDEANLKKLFALCQ